MYVYTIIWVKYSSDMKKEFVGGSRPTYLTILILVTYLSAQFQFAMAHLAEPMADNGAGTAILPFESSLQI